LSRQVLWVRTEVAAGSRVDACLILISEGRDLLAFEEIPGRMIVIESRALLERIGHQCRRYDGLIPAGRLDRRGEDERSMERA
jgi:hypothetical protein